eukprot:TRINITY_DN32_c1_g2_i4.p1 TRINITY_DN32_c1_g2~~TRINITY_DN32_c1_g2_i4.p1  ORF type:complete len:318 (+),score=89.09 TRINITY_DN32_c1_g2_i4:53-1006(+)
MKTAAALALFASATALPMEYINDNEALLWKNYKESYNKKYSGADESKRRAIFMDNMRKGSELEKANPGTEFGMNLYTDLSADEFKVYHNLNIPVEESPARVYTQPNTVESVDWRSKGAVTQVKNQGQCGSCWSFSTTGGIEGQWKLAGNALTSLSEQELVSCDKTDDGCGGGWQYQAMQWLIDNHSGGIVTEEEYPYTSGEGRVAECKDVKSMKVGATIKGYKKLAHSEDEMATFVGTNGPLSIALDATSFQTYRGGILSNCQGKTLDHAVLIVGYAPDYWIVKNSWGASWGESGYIRIARGSNQCGLDLSPVTSEV